MILRDPDLDRRLAEDGYVVVELLAAAEVRQLLDDWEGLSRSDPPVWDPTGMAATVRHPGLDERADDCIRRVVGPRLEPIFLDRVPFMSSYLVKQPGSGELPAHLDWRLDDEPVELTHGCWVPLTPGISPTEPSSGALGVCPGSHLLVDFDRTPEEPGHEWTADFVASGAAIAWLDVPVGHAVLYDHRLVHLSRANGRTTERIAINSGISSMKAEADARARLLDMMRRGMSPENGSQVVLEEPEPDNPASHESTPDDPTASGPALNQGAAGAVSVDSADDEVVERPTSLWRRLLRR